MARAIPAEFSGACQHWRAVGRSPPVRKTHNRRIAAVAPSAPSAAGLGQLASRPKTATAFRHLCWRFPQRPPATGRVATGGDPYRQQHCFLPIRLPNCGRHVALAAGRTLRL